MILRLKRNYCGATLNGTTAIQLNGTYQYWGTLTDVAYKGSEQYLALDTTIAGARLQFQPED